MADNIGIFVCGCQGAVSDVVDLAGVEAGLLKVKKSVGAKVFHPGLCSAAGASLIKETVKANGIDCMVVAGCPATVRRDFFRDIAEEAGLPPEMIFRVDIREGCAYVHRSDPGKATVKAVNLIKMWNGRARLAVPYKTVAVSGNSDVIVLGAGLAGLTAAAELAEAGINVTIIEKEAFIGGRVAQFNKIFPRMCDARCGVTFLLNRLEENPRVKILTRSEIVGLRGSAGRFEADVITRQRCVDGARCDYCGKCEPVCPVEVSSEYDFGLSRHKAIHRPYPMDPDGSYIIDRSACPAGCNMCARVCPAGAIQLSGRPASSSIKFGSLIVATGWRPYAAERVARLGFGSYDNVITSVQMERMTAPDGPTGGRLLCPGSGMEPRTVVFIQCVGSRDINHQRWCSSVCCTATLKQALWIKNQNPRTRVYVFYTDIRSAGEYEDLYLQAQEAGVIFVRSRPSEITLDSDGRALLVRGEDTLMGRTLTASADLAVLAVGMTPSGIPGVVTDFVNGLSDGVGLDYLSKYGLINQYGFFVGHKQCFPLESMAQGIYMAGSCQEPMDMSNAARSGLSAACKALRAAGGRVPVSPLAVRVDKAGCDKCKRCVEECPYGVLYLDRDGYPVPDQLYCRTCLCCVGACPRHCISAQAFSTPQLVKMITARVRELGPGEPRVIAFLCENDAYRAALEAGRLKLDYPAGVYVIPVRCVGSLNMVLIQDGLPEGIDGFMIAGCRSGECHYISGPDRTKERIENIKITLGEIMIEPERVKFLHLGVRDAAKFVSEAGKFVDQLKKMGPSPFKGMR